MNNTKTWRTFERERKQAERKPLGAGFALMIVLVLAALKALHG